MDVAVRFASVVLGPLLYLQGRQVRDSVPRLPEPPGDRTGRAGSGPKLRVLVAGDSAAAGVGAEHQEEALLGSLVEALSRHCTVEWDLAASTGATTASTLRHLRKTSRGPFDVAVTSLGVNDVTAGLSRDTWRAQQEELRKLVQDLYGVRHHVVCGLPPVHGFPALPQPLRWYLGRRASLFDRDLRDDIDAEAGATFLSLRFSEDASLMAPDGFHPGPAIYAEWGRRVADLVIPNLDDFLGSA